MRNKSADKKVIVIDFKKAAANREKKENARLIKGILTRIQHLMPKNPKPEDEPA